MNWSVLLLSLCLSTTNLNGLLLPHISSWQQKFGNEMENWEVSQQKNRTERYAWKKLNAEHRQSFTETTKCMVLYTIAKLPLPQFETEEIMQTSIITFYSKRKTIRYFKRKFLLLTLTFCKGNSSVCMCMHICVYQYPCSCT